MAGLAAAAPLIGAGVDLGASIAGGLFSANQARKNRAFQERMYERQLEDNRENWRMQNEYNLPSAQMQRLRDAGLNPLLMYGEGAPMMAAQNMADGPSAPHGGQASVGFQSNFAAAAAQSALLQAQIDNINADTGLKEAESKGTTLENEITEATKDIQIAIKYRDWDYLNTSINKMQNELYNATQITTQQVLSMMQGRWIEIERLNLDKYSIGEGIVQRWKELANGEIMANAATQQAAASMYDAVTRRQIGMAEIATMSWQLWKDQDLYPLTKQGVRLGLNQQSWDIQNKKSAWQLTSEDIKAKKIENYFKSRGLQVGNGALGSGLGLSLFVPVIDKLRKNYQNTKRNYEMRRKFRGGGASW